MLRVKCCQESHTFNKCYLDRVDKVMHLTLGLRAYLDKTIPNQDCWCPGEDRVMSWLVMIIFRIQIWLTWKDFPFFLKIIGSTNGGLFLTGYIFQHADYWTYGISFFRGKCHPGMVAGIEGSHMMMIAPGATSTYCERMVPYISKCTAQFSDILTIT